MKKALKILGKTFILLIGLLVLTYGGFRINEYFIGNKFVDYLNKNKLVSVPISKSLQLKFDDAFLANQLFLVGEIHEMGTSPVIDVSTFKTLNQQNNVTNYIAEMDIAQAYYINKYLKDSTDLKLKEILKKWVVWIGLNSTEYREQKWGNLKEYYQQLESSKRFEVYGLNRLNDFDLLNRLLKEKLPVKDTKQIPNGKDSLINWASAEMPEILKTNSFTLKDSLLLVNIEFNCSNLAKNKSRDEFMYDNLRNYYDQNNWETEKIYGCFGLYHTLQGIDNSLAGRIKKASFLNGNMLSLVALYTDSHLTIPSKMLPSYLADKGIYTRLSFGYDNLLFAYIKGVEDFKRISDKNSISLFKLDAKNSPYLKSNRGLNNFSLLKTFGGIPIDEKKVTTDYIQYLFYVNGADWMKPDE